MANPRKSSSQGCLDGSKFLFHQRFLIFHQEVTRQNPGQSFDLKAMSYATGIYQQSISNASSDLRVNLHVRGSCSIFARCTRTVIALALQTVSSGHFEFSNFVWTICS